MTSRENLQPDTAALIPAATDFCLAEGQAGYVCTEEPNHEGCHRAVLGGELLDSWPAL